MFAACRGCGNTPLTSPKPLHIALSADVYEAVRNIREKYPDAPVFLVGFSIGAYTMTKYIGEADSGVWPEGAVPFLLTPAPPPTPPHPSPCICIGHRLFKLLLLSAYFDYRLCNNYVDPEVPGRFRRHDA